MALHPRLIPWLVTLLLLPVALLGALLGALQSPAVQRWLIERVAAATAVRVEGLRVVWPLDLRVDQLGLEDAQGTWLVASGLQVEWRPAALWHGRVHLRRVRVAGIELRRPPERSASPSAVPGIPRLPLSLHLDELSVESLRVASEVVGAGMAGRVSATGELAGGQLRLGVVLAGTAAGTRGEARLSVQGRGSSIFVVGNGALRDLPDPSVLRSVDWALAGSLDAASGEVSLGYLRLATEHGRATAFGRLEAWGETVRMHVAADLPDLSLLLPSAKGQARLDGELSGSWRRPKVTASIHPRALSSGIAAIDRLVGSAPRVGVAAAFGDGFRPGLFRLRIDGDGATATAGGLLQRAWLTGLRLDLAEAAELSDGFYRGPVHAEGMLLGPSNDPLLSFSADATGTLRERPVTASLFAAADHLAGDPLGHARIQLSALGEDFEGSAGFAWGAAPRLDQLVIRSGGDGATGRLVWDRRRHAVDGQLEGQVNHLARWSKLVKGPAVDGTARFVLALRPGHGQEAKLDLTGSNLSFGELIAARFAGQARVSDLLARPLGQASVSLNRLGNSRLKLDRLRLEATGDLREVGLTAVADGPSLALAAEGRASPQAGRYRLTALTMTLGKERLRLIEPTQLSVEPTRLRLAPTRLAYAGGQVETSGSLAGDRIDGHLAFAGLPVDLLSPILPEWAPSGTAAGQLVLGGTRRQPRLSAQIEGHQLDIGGHHAGVDATAKVEWDGQRLRASFEAAGLHGSQFRGRTELPLRIGQDGLGLGEGPLSARLEGHGDLARLSELVPSGDESVGGQVELEATAGGTVGQPAIDARIKVSQGTYRNFGTGTTLSGITLSATAHDTRHIVFQAAGGDGAKGRFTAEGAADLPPFHASATLTELRLADLDLVRGNASGTIRLEGADGRGELSGTLTVDGADVDIGQTMPARVVTLDVTEINLPPGEARARPAEAADLPFELGLAVQATLKGVKLHGRGLDSEWNGQLALAGSINRVEVQGQLTAVRGTYDLFGQRLTLSQGGITFDGGHPPDPRVDVIAQGQSQGLTAQVHVTGTADKPSFEFTSDPPVPQDEVLARLIFGSDASQLSVTQQLTLARAAAGQIGGGGFDPLGKLRDVLGLDVLEAGGGATDTLTAPGLPAVPPSGPPGTSAVPIAGQQQASAAGRSIGPALSAGKYLNSRTFLRVDQGTTGGRLSVELELGGGFAVDTQVGEDAGGGVGISWKKDY